MDSKNFSVVITGEWPGAGQSITTRLLAEKLGFNRVYAGFLFRKFAHVWNIEKNRLSWPEFEDLIASNPLVLDTYSFSESDFDEENLHQWQHQLKSVNTPDLWDRIIDRQSLQTLAEPGNVVEAKIGVVLEKTGLVEDFKPNHPIYKFLLTCPPATCARRIIERQIKNGERPEMDTQSEAYEELVRITTTETIKRHLRDWERYEKIYGISRSDIDQEGISRVCTADRPAPEIASTILEIIQQKQA